MSTVARKNQLKLIIFMWSAVAYIEWFTSLIDAFCTRWLNVQRSHKMLAHVKFNYNYLSCCNDYRRSYLSLKTALIEIQFLIKAFFFDSSMYHQFMLSWYVVTVILLFKWCQSISTCAMQSTVINLTSLAHIFAQD